MLPIFTIYFFQQSQDCFQRIFGVPTKPLLPIARKPPTTPKTVCVMAKSRLQSGDVPEGTLATMGRSRRPVVEVCSASFRIRSERLIDNLKSPREQQA
jgi:hypothetical protein